ncbi:hypothetical protein KIS1582_1282 [Cytobacillus firmus]|uniref:Uncharacterized protein n=1 Tax=Cytobacillus firmus TaxID=1399 RepID=A0A800MZ16_CYTFI|nr:hypothetical protein KIS1582_1282 [Cytobacillus firmus]
MVIYRLKVSIFQKVKSILEKIRKRRQAIFSQNDKIYKKGGEFNGHHYLKFKK